MKMVSWAVFICGVILVGVWVYQSTKDENHVFEKVIHLIDTKVGQEAAKRSDLAFRVTELENTLKAHKDLIQIQIDINKRLKEDMARLEAYAKRPQSIKLEMPDDIKVKFAGRVGELPKAKTPTANRKKKTSNAIRRKVKDITH